MEIIIRREKREKRIKKKGKRESLKKGDFSRIKLLRGSSVFGQKAKKSG